MVRTQTVGEIVAELVQSHTDWRKRQEAKYIETATYLLLKSPAGEKIDQVLGDGSGNPYVCNRNWDKPNEIRVRFVSPGHEFIFEVTPGASSKKILGIYAPRGSSLRSIEIYQLEDLAKYFWLKSRR